MKNSFDEEILEEAIDWLSSKRNVILATVVQTWGSSPRPVGSRMIVNDRGDFSGSVSGGCVETCLRVGLGGGRAEGVGPRGRSVPVEHERGYGCTLECA